MRGLIGLRGMQFKIITPVQQSVADVYKQFDKSLLMKLTPPGMKVALKRYDEPTVPGSMVIIETKMLGIIKQQWENEITEVQESEDSSYFVDEGRKLPFPLKTWRHKHLIRKGNGCTEIVDDVSYSAGWLTWLIHPIVWLQFAWRKPQYRKFFGKA